MEPAGPPLPATDTPARDALRVQAAAVAAQQAELDEREARLAERSRAADERDAALAAARDELRRLRVDHADEVVRFNTQREIDSRLLADGLAGLEAEQRAWRRRRAKERLALRARAGAVAEARRLLQGECDAWDARRQALADELHGLNRRVLQQRDKLREKQEELRRVDDGLTAPRQPAAESPPAIEPAPPAEEDRVVVLRRLAGDLADQRRLVVEQWERLARVQAAWSAEREQIAAGLEALAGRLAKQEQDLVRREQGVVADEERLARRRADAEQVMQQALVARTRLQAEQQAWEGERQHVLKLARQREEQAEQHANALEELRQQWLRQRRHDADALREERAALDQLRRDVAAAREALDERAGRLEEERRLLDEKALALEEYRQELLPETAGAEGRERVERLCRRWHSRHEALVRVARHERAALRQELAAVEARRDELQKRVDRLAEAQVALDERQVVLEHREALLFARHGRLAQELREADGGRRLAERRLQLSRDEAERMARLLLADDEAPLPVDRAA